MIALNGKLLACAMLASVTTPAASAGQSPTSDPVAFVSGSAHGAIVVRDRKASPARHGLPVVADDRIMLPVGTGMQLRWRDGCISDAVVGPVGSRSPCAMGHDRMFSDNTASPLRPRALQIVKQRSRQDVNAAGTREPDVPVGP